MTPHETIAALESLGFVQDGHTRVDVVRVPTRRSPVLGKTGGERRILGGRVRLALPGTDVHVTVGARTTYVYRKLAPRSTETVAHLATRELGSVDDLRRVVSGAVDDHALDQASDAGLLHDDGAEAAAAAVAEAAVESVAEAVVEAPLAVGDYVFYVTEIDPPGEGLHTWRVDHRRVAQVRRDGGFVLNRLSGIDVRKIHPSSSLGTRYHRSATAATRAFVEVQRRQIASAHRAIAEAERAIAFAARNLPSEGSAAPESLRQMSIVPDEAVQVIMGSRDETHLGQEASSVEYPVCFYRDQASAREHARRATDHAIRIEEIGQRHPDAEPALRRGNPLDPSWERGWSGRPTIYEVVAVPLGRLPAIPAEGEEERHG